MMSRTHKDNVFSGIIERVFINMMSLNIVNSSTFFTGLFGIKSLCSSSSRVFSSIISFPRVMGFTPWGVHQHFFQSRGSMFSSKKLPLDLICHFFKMFFSPLWNSPTVRITATFGAVFPFLIVRNMYRNHTIAI